MTEIKLSEISSKAPKGFDKQKTKEDLAVLVEKLGELQNKLYAEDKHSLLIVLQGMDASGKDGAIRTVFSGINPMGCNVKSFKKPTEIEMGHDFLWRIHRNTPQRGMIQIFNRSHYEDVLIQRVRKWIDMDRVKRRYEYINFFESLLAENNTTVLKFYLHVSRDEQMKSLMDRLEDPRKKWKYNPGDIQERELWDDYMKAYEDVFRHCGPDNPWHIVPSDQNWYKEYYIAKTLVDTLESFKMEYPDLNS